ncbi:MULTISPECIES: NAD(P)/FAD-dependent oxidoreductase [unclassified Bradyrhizobium]|uniref:flavin-containing monooxygenase n=1 Tax=unclassified Bradyrhizobium TaxID=2631580 RepID=UPI001BA5DC5E|nr:MULTISPECIES: NAD(P)/FAD-dependent oxidoreductase [unclassified Bradyrhizobium]MBR1203842.1 NAD(P)/FAD-dependent oxidoreductase [Bradyrhizobium sp. AUGA SZCCT0124]MBR1310271.1 NAD(P)/FAD-dependent oxidoreductase [Bradyrhizobium sp. AUGA SZCCT0051]MBR1340413.1 NAD(P)/FAD-dependent oxidoreductase [Bradyrhizobium sp. AUGA SZCCT0105]MBR1355020.1 NAD(P)/FAD-dependent oxidoreductase [Bradyrhizobium sp. AUGA SZCCT0045]
MNIELSRKHLDLSSAIAEGDIRVLLMVLVHMTGDEKWLEPPYKPKRDVRLIPDPDAGVPKEIQDEIRAAILNLFANGTPKPVITDPGNELMLRMMRATLGENVTPEYAPLMREEMGFVPRDARWRERPSDERLAQQHVLIVGAGVCAIALGVALGRLGIPYTIVEKQDEIGGTWYVNRYPGCGVDTPNHSYSFSFGARNPWTRYFAQRQELLDYLLKVVREYGIREHVRLSTELVASRWDEAKRRWISTLKTANGAETFESTALVSAIGQLNDPLPARFEGDEDFKGLKVHSALWSDDVKLDGKHVAVIGTGATAMQLVPSIADRVASVTVYQRTAQWARPVKGYSDPITDGAQWLLAHLPFYVQWYRFNMFWRYGDGLLPFLRKDPAWPHPDRAVNKGNDRHRQELAEFILSELKDRPDLIEKCMPTYPPYGKRILLDNNWFKTLTRPNVELITDKIDHFAADGIVTADGTFRPHDVIVISTGFKVSEMAARLNITGRDGKNLKQAWRDDNPTAYLGLTVPDFPNLFLMLGPNSGPAHGGSVIFQSECQSRYISACLVEMIENDIAAIDVHPDAHDEYIRNVDAEHEQLIWTHPGMTTYYRNRSGRVFSAMPWRFVDYWKMTHDPDFTQYRKTKSRQES